jgi:uracil-DNA glycosylase family protein
MAAKIPKSAAEFLPDKISYRSLREASAGCEGCQLYKTATQTVFGEGGRESGVIFVGEQPGDEEDKLGHPFVGPAGRLLDRAFEDAGIDRNAVYLTNAVKHFKWKPRGKRRLHERPRASEIAACDPWLQAEIAFIKPRILVCLGATAAQSLLGRDFRITKMRGQWLESTLADNVMATMHPSAILRAPGELRDQQFKDLVADLLLVAKAIA